MKEISWRDIEKRAEKPLNELVTGIKSEMARENEPYPNGYWPRVGFENTLLRRAEEWLRRAFQVYRETVKGVGPESIKWEKVTWNDVMWGFIDERIAPLLEAAVGVSDEDREFLRNSVITLEQLRSLDDHPFAKSAPWRKVRNAQHLVEKLKGRWTVIFFEIRRTQDEQKRRETELHDRDIERARELEHVRKIAEIKEKGAHANSKLNYRSPWKRAIRHALVVIGSDASHQHIANWIAENTPELELPGYCTRTLGKNERGDIGHLYRSNKAVRDQFSKDVTKVKADLKR